jgi:hypothetical protein
MAVREVLHDPINPDPDADPIQEVWESQRDAEANLDAILQEDGLSLILQEDGSSKILQE